MKKTISLLLALVMCLSLCACGGGNSDTPETTEAASPTSFLTSMSWKGTDGFNSELRANFLEDGTGTYNGNECTWEMYDGIVSVSYQAQYGQANLDFEVIEYSGVTMLRGSYTFLLPAEGYKEACVAKQEYMLSVAEELNWTEAHNLKLDNGAKAKLEYEGKIVKWTATVYEIDSIYAMMSDRYEDGWPVNSINVYMDTEELVKLNSLQEYTIVGILDIETSKIRCGIVLE